MSGTTTSAAAQATHTPGPWQVTNGTDVFTALGAVRADGLAADSNDGWQIADCSMGVSFVNGELASLTSAEQRANARLIASAPALLDALRNLRKAEHFRAAVLASGDDEKLEFANEKLSAAQDAADAAIAAATGAAA